MKSAGKMIFLAWFCFVYFSYLYFHDSIHFFFFNAVLLLVLYLFYKFVIKKIGLKIRWQINISLWKAVVLLFLVAYIIACFLSIPYGDGLKSGISQIFVHWIFIFKTMFSRALFLSALCIVSASLGRKILRKLNFSFQDITTEYIFSFGAGTLTMLFISFFMGTLGILYFWYIIFALIAIVLICKNEIYFLWKNLLLQKISIQLSDNFSDKKNIVAWGYIFLSLFFLITFIQTLYLVPTEYDDLDIYYSVPLLFADYHGMVPTYNSVSAIVGGIVMPYYTTINVLLSPYYNFSISWLFLWLSLFLFYVFTKKFFSQKIAFITLFISAFVPLNINFINSQKIDFILVFFSILSVYGIFQWLNFKESKWLYLSAIFLGLTIHIKMNGLFLALSIFILLSIFLLLRKISLKHYLVYFIFAGAMLIPMVFYNMYYYHNPLAPFRFKLFSHNTENIFKFQERVTTYDIYSKTDYIFRRSDDITAITSQNNASNSRIINFFWLLWNITINQKGFNYIYSEIGPFLLIFFPFFLLHFFARKYYKDKSLVALLVLSSIYFVIWYMKGYERAWYALPILYFLFIFCARYLEKMENSKIKAISYILILIFAMRSLFFSFFFMDSQPHIINTPNISNQNLAKFPQSRLLLSLYEHINKNIIAKNKNSLILMMPESRTGTIQQWDKHIISDHWAMYWSYLVEENYSFSEIKDIFIQQGITHIFFSNSFYSWIKSFADKDDKKYQIVKNLELFEDFKNTYLIQDFCTEGHDCVYEIKK